MDYLVPALAAMIVWWGSTVVLLYRTGLPPKTFPMTVAIAFGVFVLGCLGIVATRAGTDPGSAYLGFLSGLAIWSFHEVTYLLGYVSGPKPEACPSEADTKQRFVLGVQACLYHELFILATVCILVIVTWGAPNLVGLWTFVILWAMRWSVKLNIFLGVRNLHTEFWPEHLNYLKSFVGKKTMNPLFPLSMVIALAVIALVTNQAIQASGDPTQRTGAVLLLTLLSLGAFEHGLLMLRVSDAWMWKAGSRPHLAVQSEGNMQTRP